MKKSKYPYIGITGAFGSGKTMAASFFVSQGYEMIRLSSYLEDEARSRGVTEITRKILQDIGNEWREKYGTGVLAHKAVADIKKRKLDKFIIDGIRNTGEIDVLRRIAKFCLLGVITDREMRFKRLKNRKEREDLTRELFMKLDYRDLGVHEKDTGLQVALCLGLSDVFIENNTTKEAFYKRLEEITL